MKLKGLAYLLLGCFLLLYAPKDWWHQHEQHDACIHDKEEVSFQANEEDCFVCEFVWQPAGVPLSLQYDFPTAAPLSRIQAAPARVYCAQFPNDTLRGPPAIEMIEG